ncbi:hypothetical protein Ancab_022092 [Ancistrocladus abbreviatus]
MSRVRELKTRSSYAVRSTPGHKVVGSLSLQETRVLLTSWVDFPKFDCISSRRRMASLCSQGKAGGLPLAELRGLQHLRGKLLIKGLENVGNIDDAREVDLNEMGDIDDLTFEFDGSRTNNSEKERDVLENLRPHANLEKLTISYYSATSFQVGWVIVHSKA